MGTAVTRVDTDGVAVVTIDNPPVNALSTAVAGQLKEILARAELDPAVHAVVIVGSGRAFVAGADIREFEEYTSGRKARGEGLHPLLDQIENGRLPYVCALHGNALGAGLELAMACHYRVALRGARLGQPEVKLGLIPGAGGTQRLPRLVGMIRAAEMCGGGDLVDAEQALREGLVDRVCSEGLVEAAVDWARQSSRRPEQRVKTRDRAVRYGDLEVKEIAALKDRLVAASRGAAAPSKALEAVLAAGSMSFDEGIAVEAAIFQECLYTEESRACVHLFLGERRSTRRVQLNATGGVTD